MKNPLRIPGGIALIGLLSALLIGCGPGSGDEIGYQNGRETDASDPAAPDPAAPKPAAPKAAAGALPQISVSEARIRAPVPGQDKTAAYFTIVNRGTTPFVLNTVTSPQARAIEIHTIVHEGDMARMRRLPEVVIEPGTTMRFAPGGLHLMIFGITAPVTGFKATLEAADGQRLEVPFETIALGGH